MVHEQAGQADLLWQRLFGGEQPKAKNPFASSKNRAANLDNVVVVSAKRITLNKQVGFLVERRREEPRDRSVNESN